MGKAMGLQGAGGAFGFPVGDADGLPQFHDALGQQGGLPAAGVALAQESREAGLGAGQGNVLL